MIFRLALACLTAHSVAGAVIGIDLGGRFLKVGIIQPGTGIELVLNEATQRKSSSAAGFNSQGERVYGNEAQNLLGKLPGQQFLLSKLLLGNGLASKEVQSLTEQRYPYVFEEDPLGHGAILRYDSNSTYRSEEMVAFILSYAKQIAEGHAGKGLGSIKDCVITIPPHFSHLHRHAVLSAAAIAGLNVLSLIHEPTAFAFKYGFDKESDFPSDGTSTNVVFYDLGATSYKVSVVGFSSTIGKKNKTTGSMQVKGLGWDPNLGGRDFDMVVFDTLAEEFNAKALKGKDDVRKYAKAVGKLRKAAESAKDILSANAKYQIGVEALHNDMDLRMVLSREDFEKEAEKRGLWARLSPPLQAALDQANLTIADIHRVEVVGGATRIPRVKEAALKFFGRKQLDGSLNGDEAAALGATLYAAKLSTSFRLREFTINDAYPHAASIKISGQGDSSSSSSGEEGDGSGEGGGKAKKAKLLFKAMTKMPHKKLISMTRTDDLIATLTVGEPPADDATTTTASTTPLSTFNITGVAAAYARLLKDETRTVLGKPKVSITFSLSSSGLIDVSKAEAAIEMLEGYEETEMVPANTSNSNYTEADLATLEEEHKTAKAAVEAAKEAADTEAKADSTSNSSKLANATLLNATGSVPAFPPLVSIKVSKERKRLHYVTLKVAKTVDGSDGVTPVTAEIVSEAVDRNVALLKAEQLRKVNAMAKNDLESFIIDTRGRMMEEAIESVSTEEERSEAMSTFEAAEDWLYEEGKSLEASAYKVKQKTLSALTNPIFLRASELEARPKAAAQALEAINWTQTILATWASERPEITEDERDKVAGMCANFTEWLDEKQKEQEGKSMTEAPAYLSREVTAKLDPIEAEVRRLIKKPKPKPPKAKKSNATSTSSSSSGSNSSSSSSTNSSSSGGDGDGEGGGGGGGEAEEGKEEL